MILFVYTLNLIALIFNLVFVSMILANPTYFNDIISTIIFLLSINILIGIATLIYLDKFWKDL